MIRILNWENFLSLLITTIGFIYTGSPFFFSWSFLKIMFFFLINNPAETHLFNLIYVLKLSKYFVFYKLNVFLCSYNWFNFHKNNCTHTYIYNSFTENSICDPWQPIDYWTNTPQVTKRPSVEIIFLASNNQNKNFWKLEITIYRYFKTNAKCSLTVKAHKFLK